ncbi:2Fe-2S iron-sulfur cluster-binding protein [Pseudoalteromonas sp. ASV78]|uniref:2Fe-2S iron-sulfur cluster-binding protein n=1 Tax=Pseudoalteromonas sp. ASV78 TaxID=3397851 RepID=UPI0039FB8C8E
MPKITFIQPDGEHIEVHATEGASLMQAAIENLVTGIEGECGGSGSCATCHCYLSDEWQDKVSKPDNNEGQMLEMVIEPNEFSRLSCQIKLNSSHHGLVVKLPESQY